MLSDDELGALREIERRLRWERPELARLFDSVEPPPAKSRRKRVRTRMLVAAVAFAGLALLGPRMLSEAEIKIQKSPPLPRTSPSVTNLARPKGTVSGPRRSGHILGCRRRSVTKSLNNCRDGVMKADVRHAKSKGVTFCTINSSPSSATRTDHRRPGGTGER